MAAKVICCYLLQNMRCLYLITVLVDNDIIKYKLLEIYSKRYPKEDQIVICTQDQKPRLKYLEEYVTISKYITIKILKADKIAEILKINKLDENNRQQFKKHIQQLNKIPKCLPSGLTEREEKIFTMRYGIGCEKRLGCEKKYTYRRVSKKIQRKHRTHTTDRKQCIGNIRVKKELGCNRARSLVKIQGVWRH